MIRRIARNWKGTLAGFLLGLLFGPVAAVFCAIVGNTLQESIRETISGGRYIASTFASMAGAMFAKMAKADGRISEDEIASVERSFRRLGFSEEQWKAAVKSFRAAKDDSQTIYGYASRFASLVASAEVRILFYELLWDLACADGRISPHELDILRQIPHSLNIPAYWYLIYARERLDEGAYGREAAGSGAYGGGAGGSSGSGRSAPPRDGLAEAYMLLGVDRNATDDEVKRAYRLLAKKYHPDALRAQGLPEAMVGKANERMAKINSAWALIKSSRGSVSL